MDRVLADADPRGMIRHSSLPQPGTQVPWQVVLDQQGLQVGRDEPPEPVYDPDAVLALIYTSGTTGRPKGVALTHASAMADVDHVNYWMPYRESGVDLHAAPMFHIADLPLVFAPPPVRAAPVPNPTVPRVDLRVVEEWGQELATGDSGEIVTRGANVTRGYWNDPQDTLAAFRNGMFRTGDVGYQDADGYVYIQDRLKDMIVSGGENIYSGEVEAVLYAHPAVREAAVFRVPDPKWGELVMACG